MMNIKLNRDEKDMFSFDKFFTDLQWLFTN